MGICTLTHRDEATLAQTCLFAVRLTVNTYSCHQLCLLQMPFRFAAMHETIDRVGNVVISSVVESGNAT